MATTKKVPVSKRALLARINRALTDPKWPGARLRACRPDMRGYETLGDFYEIGGHNMNIVATHVDLVKRARELGCLADFEALEE